MKCVAKSAGKKLKQYALETLKQMNAVRQLQKLVFAKLFLSIKKFPNARKF